MLINLRNALMAGKRLPYDAEVEFLASTGTQWIDTGAIPDTRDIRVDITYANGSGHLFGSRLASSFKADMWSAWAATADYCRKDWLASNTSISVAATAKTIVFSSDSTGSSITYNGTTETGGVKTTINLPMIIFGVNTNGTITTATRMTLYSFKIWKDGTLVRDFIPVRKGTVGYLYDRVSGKLFGNAGTGDFVLGPDVVPVEYIESHGTEWVDTGVAPVDDATFVVCAAFTDLNTGRFGVVQGSSLGNFRYYFGVLNGKWIGAINSPDYNHNISQADTGIHTFKTNNLGLYIDDVMVVAAGNSKPTTPVYLANINGATSNITAKAKLYPCKIYDANDTPVRSFLPIRVGTDATSWEGAMIDTLTRRIYRNAGTGAFTYGNDLKYPIPAE